MSILYRTLHYFIKVPNPKPSVKEDYQKRYKNDFKKIKQTPINELIQDY